MRYARALCKTPQPLDYGATPPPMCIAHAGMTTSGTRMSLGMEHLLLGIDIGTSNVKAVLLHKSSLKVVGESSKSLGPHLTVPEEENAYERDIHEIFTCLDKCLMSLDSTLLQSVVSIGVCGQMHGCVLWRSGKAFVSKGGTLKVDDSSSCGSLITWQDGRCSPEFLSSLPKTNQSILLSTGYGCATLAWLKRFKPDLIEGFDRAGTIMDLVVWALCTHRMEDKAKDVVMSAQNANSWGYFDITKIEWEWDILKSSWFPVHLLPRVVAAPAVAGSLHAAWHSIPQGTTVGVAMGDLQCSTLAAQPSHTDAVLNIGSASQLSVIKPKAENLCFPLPSSVMEVPYFDGNTLLTSASLAGGNVVITFVKMLQSWMTALGVTDIPDELSIYAKLVSLACESVSNSRELQLIDVGIALWGERHEPGAMGAVSKITPNNLELGGVSHAMLRGVVANLRMMMPEQVFQQLKITKLLGSGKSFQKCDPALRKCTESVFGLPLLIKDGADAPQGAAMAVQTISKLKTV